jgi:hypothetical protein
VNIGELAAGVTQPWAQDSVFAPWVGGGDAGRIGGVGDTAAELGVPPPEKVGVTMVGLFVNGPVGPG